jgi:hypothetical protein
MAFTQGVPVDVDDVLVEHNADGTHKRAGNIDRGLSANKPATCVTGDIYFATDTQILYLCHTIDTWTALGAGILVSSDDTTAGYLNGKLVATNGLLLTENNGGANETLSLLPQPPSLADGRLTLETGVAASTTDQLAKGTVYYTPYKGEVVNLWTGSVWKPVVFTEKSIAVPADANGKMYDVFGYLSGSALALEVLAWTNTTTRATALVRQNGVLCKTGDLTRRYLGSFYGSANSQTDDGIAKRHLFNCDNRLLRSLEFKETTDSWTHAVAATWRQWRGVAGATFDVVAGLPGEVMFEGAMTLNVTLGATGVVVVGFGINSTSAVTQGITMPHTVISTRQSARADLRSILAIGLNAINALEYNTTATSYTAYGDNAVAYFNSGMVGSVMI